jgi:hypothetical protein
MSNGHPQMVKYEDDVEFTERAWWQTCSTAEVRAKAAVIDDAEVDATAIEMEGALTALKMQLEDRAAERGSPWWRRARTALSHTTEKHAFVRAEQRRRQRGQ